MNWYYAGALSPPVAGLLGIGGALAWERRRERATQAVTAGIVVVTVGYGAWLLPAGAPGSHLARHRHRAGRRGRRGAAGAAVGRRGGRAVRAATVTGPGRDVAPSWCPGGAVPRWRSSSSPWLPARRWWPSHWAPSTRRSSPRASRPSSAVVAPLPSPPVVRSSPPSGVLTVASQPPQWSPVHLRHGGGGAPPRRLHRHHPGPVGRPRPRSMIARGLFHLALIATPTATPSARFIAAHCLHVQSAGRRRFKQRVYDCLG